MVDFEGNQCLALVCDEVDVEAESRGWSCEVEVTGIVSIVQVIAWRRSLLAIVDDGCMIRVQVQLVEEIRYY